MIWSQKLSAAENKRLTDYVTRMTDHAIFSLDLSGLRNDFRRYVQSFYEDDEYSIAESAREFFEAQNLADMVASPSSMTTNLEFLPAGIKVLALKNVPLTDDEKSDVAKHMSRVIMLETYRNS